MTGLFGIGAALLAGIAAIVANQDFDADIVPFFVALTVAGGAHAWATSTRLRGGRRIVALGITAAWAVAGVWIGALLGMYQAMCACSRPPPPVELTYLGIPATAYHLIGLYGGLVLIIAGTRLAHRRRDDVTPP
jgi:hypothetical protein